MLSTKTLTLFFILPIVGTIVLNIIFPKPPADHGSGSMFDLIATRYDFINRALALNLDIGWRKVMVREVTSNGKIFDMKDEDGNDKNDVHILDLATGTADVAILLAKEYDQIVSKSSGSTFSGGNKKNVHILGVDPSLNMITVGRQKIKSNDLTDKIKLEIGDARELTDLPDNKFSAGTMSFGIRNVPEKEKALCEIHRVLRKDESTKFAILEFSEPTAEAGIMGALAKVFIRYVVPIIGASLSGAPREYMHLQNSIKEFPSPKQFVALMEGLNCENENGGRGTFRVDNLIHMNFGSVQLYVATPIVIN
mmetsp:Transcript_23652/g.27352  ORF Transcript_23652/g.27352 Transcript_23652/m.27352 type:complete len:309 (+) Transcript_23652:166-1092(+)